jgi:hypothetical protein
MSATKNEDLDATYWKGVFVPVVVTMLIFISVFVFIFTYTGKERILINKSPIIPRTIR